MSGPDYKHRAGLRRFSRLGVALLATAAPVVAWAVCTCGFGDGQFTLVTITADGDLSDWAPVHADTDNNVCDGPANGDADRDAPVQSTGRDLTHFAFTWDQNNIYLFTERSGSANNTQSFVYYADTNNDRFMQTGEPVIGVTWRGNNRRVNVYTYTYVAQAAGGDSMVDNNGFADGYTLPGSFANIPSSNNPNRSGTWGSADGRQMEFPITWGELGVSPGAAFTFHVASSNASLGAGSFTAQIDDNLSGCGGTLGSTGASGVLLTPDRTLVGFPSRTAVGIHTLTNIGNQPDSYDFSSTSSGDFSPTAIAYYHDVDADGVVTAVDVLLTDTDGDGDPNTASVAPGTTIDILFTYDVPASVTTGDVATVSTTAASAFQPLATDFVVDTIEAALPPDIVVNKAFSTIDDPINATIDPKPIPGGRILYSITVSNEGAGVADSDSVVVTDVTPTNLCFIVTDIGTPGSGPVAFQDGTPSSGLSYTFASLGSTTDDVDFSNNNGLTFDYSPADAGAGCDPSITNFRVNLSGIFAADIGNGTPQFELSFRAVIN